MERGVVLLVQFLSFFNDFFLVFVVAFGRCIFLCLVAKVRSRDFHLPPLCRLAESKVCIIQELDCQINAFGAKIHDESIAFVVAVVVGVELDTGFTAVNFFCNDAAAGKDVVDFLDCDVCGKRCYVDSCVLAFTGF